MTHIALPISRTLHIPKLCLYTVKVQNDLFKELERCGVTRIDILIFWMRYFNNVSILLLYVHTVNRVTDFVLLLSEVHNIIYCTNYLNEMSTIFITHFKVTTFLYKE